MLQCHLSLWVRYRPSSRTWLRILVYWPETRSLLHHPKSWKVINDILKWDNVQDFRNSSKLFTPKNSSEADLISDKYDIKGPIWTDFVRIDPLSFYREFYRLFRFLSNFVFDKIKKFIKKRIFRSTRIRISVEWSRSILERCWHDRIWQTQKWNSVSDSKLWTY